MDALFGVTAEIEAAETVVVSVGVDAVILLCLRSYRQRKDQSLKSFSC